MRAVWTAHLILHALNNLIIFGETYDGVSKSFRTGRLERELQMVQFSATRFSCIAILWVSLVNFAAITLCIASQRVFIVVVYFVIDSVRKVLDAPSYTLQIFSLCSLLQYLATWFLHFSTLASSVAAAAQSVEWLGYKLEGRGSIPGRGWEFFSPPRPDLFWDSPGPLSSRYGGSFPLG
jgi:hypothetical protein